MLSTYRCPDQGQDDPMGHHDHLASSTRILLWHKHYQISSSRSMWTMSSKTSKQGMHQSVHSRTGLHDLTGRLPGARHRLKGQTSWHLMQAQSGRIAETLGKHKHVCKSAVTGRNSCAANEVKVLSPSGGSAGDLKYVMTSAAGSGRRGRREESIVCLVRDGQLSIADVQEAWQPASRKAGHSVARALCHVSAAVCQYLGSTGKLDGLVYASASSGFCVKKQEA